MPDITFRPVAEGDLPMLAHWLAQPHLSDDDPVEEMAAIRADLRGGASARFDMWIGAVDGMPLAYLQDCGMGPRVQPFHRDEAPGTRSMGLFIGPPEYLGRGYAAPLIAGFATHLRRRGTPRLIADIEPDNAPSLAAFARAGFRPEGARRNKGGRTVLLFAQTFAAAEIVSGHSGPDRPKRPAFRAIT